jgi:hypothetical protein
MQPFLDYNIKAFRAGGWCIQPEKKIVKALQNNGIKIDSSVIRNDYSGNKQIEYFDYRNTPKEEYWKFNADIGITTALKRSRHTFLLEIPVYSKNNIYTFVYKLQQILKRRMKSRRVKKKPRGVSCLISKSILERMRQLFLQPMRFSLDNVDNIPYYIACINRSIANKGDKIFCLYFHPKLLSNEDIGIIINELVKIDKKIQFCTLSTVYEKINNSKSEIE